MQSQVLREKATQRRILLFSSKVRHCRLTQWLCVCQGWVFYEWAMRLSPYIKLRKIILEGFGAVIGVTLQTNGRHCFWISTHRKSHEAFDEERAWPAGGWEVSPKFLEPPEPHDPPTKQCWSYNTCDTYHRCEQENLTQRSYRIGTHFCTGCFNADFSFFFFWIRAFRNILSRCLMQQMNL